LLVQVRQVVNLSSYVDIGSKLYGKKVKLAVQIALACSQTSFCLAYVYFIISNLHVIMHQEFLFTHDKWVTAGGCLIVFTLLCWVRKIEVFASTHLFGDIMILITLLYVIIEGAFVLEN